MSGRAAIDTNLLLLLIVGTVRRDFIAKHKRLKGYSPDDFELLGRTIRNVDVMLTTPNTLTEVSNLLVQGVADPLRTELLRAFVALLPYMDERHNLCRLTVADPLFPRLGLTDATWLCLLEAGVPLLTDDNDLFSAAIGRGFVAFRLADLRRLAGGVQH